MSEPRKTMTTAAALVRYRKELIEGGFGFEAAETMARDAGRLLVEDGGLCVSTKDDAE